MAFRRLGNPLNALRSPHRTLGRSLHAYRYFADNIESAPRAVYAVEDMKRLHLRLGMIAFITLFAVSCVSVPQREGRVEALLEELNTAGIDRLVELSATPFLLDGEIIALEQDVRTMWTNLRDVGFTFASASIQELGPVTDQTYLLFADTMDARVWFDRYAAEDAGLARVDTSHGSFLIVTGSRVGRVPMIFGFTGPEEG